LTCEKDYIKLAKAKGFSVAQTFCGFTQKRRTVMINWKLAFLVSGAGYGINILVLIIISLLIWLSNLAIKRSKKNN
jgi:hypothetical protein